MERQNIKSKIVRHGYKLILKTTTIDNHVVMLNFGISHIVSFVVSGNRTHHEIRPQPIPKQNKQKNTKKEKTVFIDSKNTVFTVSRNQGNKHIMGYLWKWTDYNLDYKCPDYDRPATIDIYDQTMISLESNSVYYDRV